MNDIKAIYYLDRPLDVKLLLDIYCNGMFPMAISKDSDKIDIIEPNTRGIIPLDAYKPSKSLAKLIKKNIYNVRHNTCFDKIIKNCANRDDTWINNEIIKLYNQLFELGFAHSIEVFKENELVGGCYGIAIKKAFFGESMFSIAPNSSKVALAFLVNILKENNYTLLDTQFVTPHLKTLGCIGIPQEEYLKLLKNALE